MTLLLALIWGIFIFAGALALLESAGALHRRFFRPVREKERLAAGPYTFVETGRALLRHLAAYHTGLPWPGYRRVVQKNLFLARMEDRLNFEEFLVIKETAVLAAGCVLAAFAAELLGPWMCLLLSAGAFWLPDLWLKEKVLVMKKGILKALPDTLDLLIACVEAGLGLDAALAKVAGPGARDPLSGEIRQALGEMRLGKTRGEALEALSGRVDLPELSTVIRALLQADRMGISMGGSLRVQAEELRTQRRQRAEKLALEAPVKLLFPLLLFIFPVVFLIIFAPIMIQLMGSFK